MTAKPSAPPPWSAIRPLFTDRDVACMSGRGYALDDYAAVKADATEILESVENGSMPPGRPWSAEQIGLLRAWIDAGCPEGVPDPSPVVELPSPDDERRAFHVLMNIEDHRDFEPTARRWAHAYLASADFDADLLYGRFDYSLEAFRERMQAIYDAQLAVMHAPHPYDQPLFVWSDGRRYPIGPFSDAAVKDRLLQLAPFNLTDGSWLQNVVTARPIDEVSAHLFDIWADEAGNGNVEENHSNVYDTLLKSLGFYLPPVTSADFIDIDVLPSAWRAPVFELCVGLFPQEFLPELLGMTLLLEWEATPQMLPMVNLLEGRGINPLFYKLHMAIDNIDSGHGALARRACPDRT
ncbi:MAG: iron-containing redox enzyme family protein [Solirubrobacteraceae bacterium]